MEKVAVMPSGYKRKYSIDRFLRKLHLIMIVLHKQKIPGFQAKIFKAKHVTHYFLIKKITANLGIIVANAASEESWFYQAIDF